MGPFWLTKIQLLCFCVAPVALKFHSFFILLIRRPDMLDGYFIFANIFCLHFGEIAKVAMGESAKQG